MEPSNPAAVYHTFDWFYTIIWTILGLMGAGIAIGVRLGRGEKINKWVLITTLTTGASISGTCTKALVKFANLDAGWAGAVALMLGVMAMGFVINAMDGKVPFINRLMGK